MHGSETISPWVARWAHLVPAGGTVLDVACGLGRHALHFSQLNHPVALVDRAQAAIESVAIQLPARSRCITADIENGPWPFMDSAGKPQQFAGVVVTNYLWRALLPTIVQSVAPGGVLIYETFAVGNETVGKPSRPDFLLQPGELLAACAGLRIVAYEDGFVSNPERFVQRIVAVRPAPQPQAHQNNADSASISSPLAPTRYAL
jgi:SAM-dependent methyltransferase